jgi:hypothetical protein
VALPVLTANSPSAGYIAWTSFGITYNGVSVVIAAGNTPNLFAYCLWNGGAPSTVLSTTNNRAVIDALLPADLVLFVNRGGIPLNVQATSLIDGSLIVSGSIIGDSIQANTIDAGKLLADTITAREIHAGAVTANELSISSLGSYAAVNGDMDDVDLTTHVPSGWTPGFERTGGPGVYADETVTPLSGATSVKISVAANAVEGMAARATPCKAGDKIMFGVAFRTSVTSVPVTLRAYFGTVDGFARSQVVAATPNTPTNIYIFDVSATGLVARGDLPTPLAGPGIAAILDGWRTPVITTLYVTGQIEVPTGARFVRFMLCSGLPAVSSAHVATWDALEYAPVVTNVRIADGAITAKSLAADAITGQTITGGVINGGIINGGGINGSEIATALPGTARVMLGPSVYHSGAPSILWDFGTGSVQWSNPSIEAGTDKKMVVSGTSGAFGQDDVVFGVPTDVGGTGASMRHTSRGSSGSSMAELLIDGENSVVDITAGQPRLHGVLWNFTKAADAIVTANSSGNALINYGVTFTSPPIVLVSNGDSASGPNLVLSILQSPNAPTTTGFYVNMKLGNTGANLTAASGARRISFIAVGSLV